MDAEASTVHAFKNEHGMATDVKGKEKEVNNRPVVNVTYIPEVSVSGIKKKILVDLNQPSGERLRLL